MPRSKYLLGEEDIPRRRHNIVADMPVKPRPPLHPAAMMQAIMPEANHAAAAVCETPAMRGAGDKRVILINLCGHGLLDMAAYDDFFAGRLERHILSDDEIKAALARLETPPVTG